jgi:hypothetical protein
MARKKSRNRECIRGTTTHQLRLHDRLPDVGVLSRRPAKPAVEHTVRIGLGGDRGEDETVNLVHASSDECLLGPRQTCNFKFVQNFALRYVQRRISHPQLCVLELARHGETDKPTMTTPL